MAEAILTNQSRNVWTEVKKVTKANNCVPGQIDGKTKWVDISNHFAAKYSDIYNSISYDDKDMAELLSLIDNGITSECSSSKC